MKLGVRYWQGMAALLVVCALTGCGSLPQSGTYSKKQAARNGSRSVPALPRAGSGRGGYYQDDGPGDNPPEGLFDAPDAEPKIEPYSTRANQPYVVFGKTYIPFTDDRPLRQRGIGSWYGRKFHGQKTSSGELYDMYKMTAAHPVLPIPSYARVTNLGNGKQVIVRINDRGPFHADRIIDLSYTAALKLGYLGTGSAELQVERLLPDEIMRMAAARQNQAQPEPVPSAAAVAVSALPAEIQATNAAPAAEAAPAADGGLYLQLGAYAKAANAEAARKRLAQRWAATLPAPQVVQSGSMYRIYSGPFDSRFEANSAAEQVAGAGMAKPIVVER